MDFLDPKKQFRHRMILLSGYVLIAAAILIATIILLYQSYGFGVGKNGQVIQNGLVFLSSQPNPSSIYIDGKLYKSQTNTRVVLPSGDYTIRLSRSGYRDWQRAITVQGGDVQHFDYPFLFPKDLKATKLADYPTAPALATQSPDHRWLLVANAGSMTSFDLYDLKNPSQAATTVTLPSGLLTKATGSENWELVSWANDNQHILLKHNYDGKAEFVLVDRANPDQSLNLNATLNTTPTAITLSNTKYDQYYVYDATTQTLQTASLKSPTLVPVLTNVLNYKTYSDNTILYATDSGAAAGKVDIKMLSGDQTYQIREVAAGTTYLLDLTTYSGTMYVVLGASSENKVYIYKDPVGQLSSAAAKAAVALRTLRVNAANYVSFSPNAQFIMAENGTQFVVYDIENVRSYSYQTAIAPLDAPQPHAAWMDGDRLTYVSNGKLVVFDYDHTNPQTLITANAGYLPFFAPDYKYVYTLTPNATATELDQTPLLTSADL